ncbi:MAG: shikimate dehydrogenase [Burkholderiaceae bacterium]
MPTPATEAVDRYAVLGNPVAHSRSPFIHAAFAAATGQPLRYERVLAPLDGFEASLRAFAAAGGKGCNVTVPFKFELPALCRERSARVELAQAANTVRFDADGWACDNTDGIGLVADIERNAGVALAGRHVLLIGAGGAAAGVLGPLLEARPAEVVVVNRTADKAAALCARHTALAAACGAALRGGGLGLAASAAGSGFDVVLNASASSLAGAEVPVPASVLKPGTLAVDLMYGPAAAPFLHWASARGAVARDGLGMLVEQAAAAFAWWRGVRPETAPVLAALRAALAQEAAAP